MALGNIKVDRTAVIARVEDAIKNGEKIVKDGEKAQATLDKAATTAEAAVTKAAQSVLTSTTPNVDVRTWNRQVTISVSLDPSEAETVIKAEQAANEARNDANENRHAVRQAEAQVKDAKRDLALLNASSEVTINVKTAGFLGYFE